MKRDFEPRRRRHSAAEIERILAEYRDGTHTQAEVAVRHGISVGTLGNWLRRAPTGGPVSPPDGDWIEVVSETPAATEAYRIELPGGRALVLGADWRPAAVRELVSLLCQP